MSASKSAMGADGDDTIEEASSRLDILILDINQLAGEHADASAYRPLLEVRSYLEEASGILHHLIQKGTAS